VIRQHSTSAVPSLWRSTTLMTAGRRATCANRTRGSNAGTYNLANLLVRAQWPA
jgi:hypothetical protein